MPPALVRRRSNCSAARGSEQKTGPFLKSEVGEALSEQEVLVVSLTQVHVPRAMPLAAAVVDASEPECTAQVPARMPEHRHHRALPTPI
jgi:hypothetical protein